MVDISWYIYTYNGISKPTNITGEPPCGECWELLEVVQLEQH